MASGEAQNAKSAASFAFCNLAKKGEPTFLLQPLSKECNYARNIEGVEPVLESEKPEQVVENKVHEACKICPVLLSTLAIHNVTLEQLLAAVSA